MSNKTKAQILEVVRNVVIFARDSGFVDELCEDGCEEFEKLASLVGLANEDLLKGGKLVQAANIDAKYAEEYPYFADEFNNPYFYKSGLFDECFVSMDSSSSNIETDDSVELKSITKAEFINLI